jgi:glycerophosphoryl diester phosphodiesterase
MAETDDPICPLCGTSLAPVRDVPPEPPRRSRPPILVVVAIVIVALAATITTVALRALPPAQSASSPSTSSSAAGASPRQAPSSPNSATAGPTTPSTSASPVDTSQVLLDEDFSSGEVPASWSQFDGEWTVADGALEGTTDDARARISFGIDSPKNFVFEGTVRFVSVLNPSRWLNIGLDFHVEDDWGGVFVLRSGTTAGNGLELAQRRSPDDPYVSSPIHAAPRAVGTGRTHSLRIEVHGKKVAASIDGKVVFHATNLRRSGGELGLVINNSTVQFDNLRIIDLNG